jgi:hypothetical protein
VFCRKLKNHFCYDSATFLTDENVEVAEQAFFLFPERLLSAIRQLADLCGE